MYIYCIQYTTKTLYGCKSLYFFHTFIVLYQLEKKLRKSLTVSVIEQQVISTFITNFNLKFKLRHLKSTREILQEIKGPESLDSLK